jgi:hypothetical protein
MKRKEIFIIEWKSRSKIKKNVIKMTEFANSFDDLIVKYKNFLKDEEKIDSEPNFYKRVIKNLTLRQKIILRKRISKLKENGK